jgi:hypothetical protein
MGMGMGAAMVRRVCVIAALVVVAAGCTADAKVTAPSPIASRASSAARATPVASPTARASDHELERVIGHPVTADINVDGRPDRAVLRVWRRRADGLLRDALVVSLGRGRLLRLAIPDDGTARYPLDSLLGHADVNGDGRSELVLFLSGNDEFSAAIVSLVNHRLVWAKSPDYVPFFAAHGKSCGACTQDASCQYVDGHPRLVESYSIYLTKRGRDLTGIERYKTHDNSPLASHRRRWEATIYDLRGPRFVKLKTLRGVVPPEGALPPTYEFDDALSCGTAHWGLDS